MARLFLSYAREDRSAVEPLAAALERAGHDVWWDRKIAGGAEYSGEIEAALERAEAVIVVWTRTSARSAWVRDEAGFARDQGKLLPVLVDDGGPPLGFRQIHAVDLKSWDGTTKTGGLAELLRAIDVRTRSPQGQVSAEPPRQGAEPRFAAASQVHSPQPPLQQQSSALQRPVYATQQEARDASPGERRQRVRMVIGAALALLLAKCIFVDSVDPDSRSPKITIEGDARQSDQPGEAVAERDVGGRHIEVSKVGDRGRITITPSTGSTDKSEAPETNASPFVPPPPPPVPAAPKPPQPK